jgi:flavin-dependent dehydrogenase
MPKYETGGNNQESNPGDNKKNVKETKPEAISKQDEQDGKILSELIKKWDKEWGRKIREILEREEANSESDAVKSLKKLAENLKTPEEIKALIDGLKDIGEKVKDDDLGLSKLKGEGKDE